MKLSLCLCSVVAALGCGDNLNPAPAVLDDLQIVGTNRPMFPAFDPGIADYAVIADADAAASVRLAADADLVVKVDGVLAASGEDLALAAEPGDTIEILVDNGVDLPTSYRVRYLPSDFPALEVTVVEPTASPLPIYLTLSGSDANFIAILDNHGVPRFYRRTEQSVFDFKRHPNGQYTYAEATGTLNSFERADYRIVILDDDLVELDRVGAVGLSHTDLHDFHILDNGNYLLMSYDGGYRDMTPFGGTSKQLVEDSVIQEVTPAGELVWEWNSWGALGWEDKVNTHPSDYAHVNSFVVGDNGNLLVSARGTSQVFEVDRDTGEIVWKLGGKSNSFTMVDDPFASLCGQHTASWIGDDHVLLFDNGQYCWPDADSRGKLTRISEYQLDFTQMTARLVWSYDRPDAYSLFMGSSQRLDNGNTLIGWGRGPEQVATEVDAAGQIVWELEYGDMTLPPFVYRVQRF